MVVDFETQDTKGDFILVKTTQFKARNLIRIRPGDINFMPNFGFDIEQFEGQTEKAFKLAISRYLIENSVDVSDIQLQLTDSKGIIRIIQKICTNVYRKGEN